MALFHQIRRHEDQPAKKAPIKAAPKVKAKLEKQIEAIADKHKPGPKPTGSAKKQITIRLSPDVIDAYKKSGAGWQARIDADLRKARGL